MPRCAAISADAAPICRYGRPFTAPPGEVEHEHCRKTNQPTQPPRLPQDRYSRYGRLADRILPAGQGPARGRSRRCFKDAECLRAHRNRRCGDLHHPQARKRPGDHDLAITAPRRRAGSRLDEDPVGLRADRSRLCAWRFAGHRRQQRRPNDLYPASSGGSRCARNVDPGGRGALGHRQSPVPCGKQYRHQYRHQRAVELRQSG